MTVEQLRVARPKEDARPAYWLRPSHPEGVKFLEALQDEPRLALDTEADPFHRYFEKVCLIQISSPEADYLFDPLEDGMPDSLKELLCAPGRLWVLHGADYDVRALRRDFEVKLGRIFDTSVAARILGRANLGLKDLLHELLEVEISKKEQRSDWGKRPLSLAQQQYALADTRHLLELAEVLKGELEQQDRLLWLEEECAILKTAQHQPRVFDEESWRKVKGAKELRAVGRKVLRAIFLWREQQAQHQDVPAFRVLRNDQLLRLAQIIERDGNWRLAQLKRLKFLPKFLDWSSLEKVLVDGVAAEDPGPRRKPGPSHGKTKGSLDGEGKKRLARLRKGREQWAQTLALDPGFLVSGATLERVASAQPRDLSQLRKIDGLTRWRVDVLGAQIIAALEL